MGAGLGMALGGMLQGMGAGMMQQQQVKDQERRDAALAALRRQERQEDSALTDQRDASHTARALTADIARDDHKTENDLKIGGQAATAARENREDTQKFQIDLETLKGRQELERSIAEVNARARADGDRIVRTEVDAVTGAITGIKANGQAAILPGVIARPQPRAAAASASSLLGDDLGAPAATPGTIQPDFIFDTKTGQLKPNPNKGR